MIIDLPKSFCMRCPTSPKGAYVEDGILKIRRDASFRKAMSEIAYEMKGRYRCCYCKQPVLAEEITIDHMYPQEFGGPTISNNLLPSCKKCNNEKGNLNTSQYKAYLKAKKEGKAKVFRKNIDKYQDFLRKWMEFGIPAEWLTEKEISQLIVIFDLEESYKDKKYYKIAKYYETYHHFQKPVIIDRQGFVLDGFLAVMYAKNVGLKKVPVIQLENVEIIL